MGKRYYWIDDLIIFWMFFFLPFGMLGAITELRLLFTTIYLTVPVILIIIKLQLKRIELESQEG